MLLRPSANCKRPLDDAETGIHVVNLEMKKTTVPMPVQPSFNEVNQSLQEKEKMIYQAREAYNKIIPEASGEAERSVGMPRAMPLSASTRPWVMPTVFLPCWMNTRKPRM